MLREVEITRYVTPLREGSSLPALVEADDGAEYVIKFRGAGHGAKALVAELVAGEIGRALGLPVPELVIADAARGDRAGESHDEIRDLLGWSIGLNIGLAFVAGALAPDLDRGPLEGPDWAAEVVWFDDLIVNPDRTPRNANLVVHDGRTWLIDHGSALYVHHAWHDPDEHAARPFERIRDHVLLPFAGSIERGRRAARAAPAPPIIDAILDAIPDGWLADARFDGPDAERDAYRRYLASRLAARPTWVAEAERARGEVQRVPSRSAFTYAVLRIVPDIEREEFVNVGLILFARERRFLAPGTGQDAARSTRCMATAITRPSCPAGAGRADRGW